MQKGQRTFQKDKNRLVIPEAYIIEESLEKKPEPYHENELKVPSFNGFELDDSSSANIEESSVIIIDF